MNKNLPAGRRKSGMKPRTTDSNGLSMQYQESVRTEILQHLAAPGSHVSIESVANSIGIRVRTLQRKLSGCGATFRALVDECRHEKALEMLDDGRFSIGEIGQRLGYSDPAHFARAFRRWSRRAPSDFLNRGKARTN